MILPPIPSWLPLIALLVSVLSLFLAVMIAAGQRRALRRLMGAVSEPELRQAVLRVASEFEPLTGRVAALEAGLARLGEACTRSLTAPGVVRFQAFDTDGPALSFSVALLDGRRNGVVLTSLHARDRVRLYAKEISAGTSAHALSGEEAHAMELALKGEPALTVDHSAGRRVAP